MAVYVRKITETPAAGVVFVRWLLIGARGWVEFKMSRFDQAGIADGVEPPAFAAGPDRVWLPVDMWWHCPKTEWDHLPDPGELLRCEVVDGPCDHRALSPDDARSLAAKWGAGFDDAAIWDELERVYSEMP